MSCPPVVLASSASASGSSSYNEIEASTSYIEQGELRKFTGDIKGEILRTGMFQLVQGTPYTASSKGDVYDVIKDAEPLTEAVTYAFPSNGKIPSDYKMFQPRLGIVWVPRKEKGDKLEAKDDAAAK